MLVEVVIGLCAEQEAAIEGIAKRAGRNRRARVGGHVELRRVLHRLLRRETDGSHSGEGRDRRAGPNGGVIQ